MLQLTRQERLALGVTALLLCAGGTARLSAPRPPEAQWQHSGAAADTSRGEADAGAVRREAERAAARERVRAQPLAAGEKIDPNRADADQLDRLPRVGPALARRMVAWREEHGPFRSLASLDSVPGVGPSMLAALAPLLALPAAPARAEPDRVELNRAGAAQLEALPGVGPALAARIVEWRERNGPFRSLDQLEEVRGVGPALRARLAPHLRVGP